MAAKKLRCCFSLSRSDSVLYRQNRIRCRFNPLLPPGGKQGCAPASSVRFRPIRCDSVLYRHKRLRCCSNPIRPPGGKKAALLLHFSPIRSNSVRFRPIRSPGGNERLRCRQQVAFTFRGSERGGSRYGARWLVVVRLLHLRGVKGEWCR